jgi:hypothetical protein
VAPTTQVDRQHLPITGPGPVAVAAALAAALVAIGLMLRRGRRRPDEILVSEPL